MELQQYIAVLRRRKWIILGTTVLGVLLAALLSYLATPVYRSATTVRVATFGGGIAGQYPNIVYSERLMNTYANIVTGGSTLETIEARLGLEEAPEIDVEIIPNTELLKILAEATSAEVAQAAAEASAEILIEESRDLYIGSGQTTLDILRQQLDQAESDLANLRNNYEGLLTTEEADSPRLATAAQAIELRERTYAGLLDQYEAVRLNEAFVENAVSVVEPAWLPESPAKPRTNLNLVLGFMVGMMAGVALALLRENLDTRLYSPSQIAAFTNMSITGRIPTGDGEMEVLGLNGSTDRHTPQLEAFRRLRINLLSFIPDGQPYVILVTSATEREGKSTVAANLAVSIAKSGRTVALVDCDMHNPTLHTLFDMPNDQGLTSFLINQAGIGALLRPTDLSSLQVVPNGPGLMIPVDVPLSTRMTPAPLAERIRHGSELLGSPQMRTFLQELRERYDVIVLDTPALSTVSDAAILVPTADHVLLVVAQAQSQRGALRSAREQLGVMNVRSMSLVVNRVDHAG